MENSRETGLLKQSIIAYSGDVYPDLNINKVKCLVFNETIIPLALVGYELMITGSVLRTSSAIWHVE